MKLVVGPMELEDIPQVLEVDRESYTLPWPASAYRREVLHNRNARYFVLRRIPDEEEDAPPVDEREAEPRPRLPIPFFKWPMKAGEPARPRPGIVLGYAGMWMMVDEAHITTIALRSEWRGKGLGELLLASLVGAARDLGARRVTLEVRVSNQTAQTLYRKYGFHEEGLRRRYYSDNNEDAYIMSTGPIQAADYGHGFDRLVDALYGRLKSGVDMSVVAPPFPLPPIEAGADAGAYPRH